jgi:hypothetical protein
MIMEAIDWIEKIPAITQSVELSEYTNNLFLIIDFLLMSIVISWIWMRLRNVIHIEWELPIPDTSARTTPLYYADTKLQSLNIYRYSHFHWLELDLWIRDISKLWKAFLSPKIGPNREVLLAPTFFCNLIIEKFFSPSSSLMVASSTSYQTHSESFGRGWFRNTTHQINRARSRSPEKSWNLHLICTAHRRIIELCRELMKWPGFAKLLQRLHCAIHLRCRRCGKSWVDLVSKNELVLCVMMLLSLYRLS